MLYFGLHKKQADKTYPQTLLQGISQIRWLCNYTSAIGYGKRGWEGPKEISSLSVAQNRVAASGCAWLSRWGTAASGNQVTMLLSIQPGGCCPPLLLAHDLVVIQMLSFQHSFSPAWPCTAHSAVRGSSSPGAGLCICVLAKMHEGFLVAPSCSLTMALEGQPCLWVLTGSCSLVSSANSMLTSFLPMELLSGFLLRFLASCIIHHSVWERHHSLPNKLLTHLPARNEHSRCPRQFQRAGETTTSRNRLYVTFKSYIHFREESFWRGISQLFKTGIYYM